MPQEAAQEPAKRRSLFKRKKRKADVTPSHAPIPAPVPALNRALNPSMGPSMNPMAAVRNAIPQNALPAAVKTGLPRLVVFGAGLVLGVLGTLLSIMLFSPSEPQRAIVAADGAVNAVSGIVSEGIEGPQSALTDEMLLKSQKKG